MAIEPPRWLRFCLLYTSTQVTIWGNHSNTQYPDFTNAKINGKPATEVITDRSWLENTYVPQVQNRGAAVIKARGSSSAASAASAAIDHVRTWMLGTPDGDWTSMAVPADGSYGIEEGVIYSYPVTCRDGDYRIVPGLSIDEFSRARMDASTAELLSERDNVKALLDP